MTIQQDKGVFVVLKQSRNKTARSTMMVRAKVKDLRMGSNVELPWNGGDKTTLTHIEEGKMQYLYDADDALMFMDNETYGQIGIPKDHLKWEISLMKPNDNVNISMFESKILDVTLSGRMVLQIMEYEPAIGGGTATSASENIILEPGLEIKVSLFINQDEMVLVNTSDGKCSGRAKD